MEFLYGFCNGWMRQRILQGLLRSILRHVLMLTFAFFISFTISIMSIRAMMPVEQSRMFMVLHDSLELEDVQMHNKEVARYYGFLNVKESPTTGFPYEVQLTFRHRASTKPSVEDTPPQMMKGKLQLTFRSASGVPVVAKNAGFKINMNGGGDASDFFALHEFPVGKLLAPVSDGSLLLLCDNCSKPDLFGHVEVTFKLDCHSDIYTRLLCYRPTKWAVIGWTMVALSSTFMAVITSTLVATKIVNLILSEFVRIVFNKTSDTLSSYSGRFMNWKQQPVSVQKPIDTKINNQKPLSSSDQSSESIDDLLSTIRAASAHQMKNTSDGKDMKEEPDTSFQCPVIVIDTSNLSDDENKTDEGVADDGLIDPDEETQDEGSQLWSKVIQMAADHISSDEEQINQTGVAEEPTISEPNPIVQNVCSDPETLEKYRQANGNIADYPSNKDSEEMHPTDFQEDAFNGLARLVELLKEI